MQLAPALVSPAGVIGPGRVGTAISRMSHPNLPRFGRSCDLPKQGPLWVCTTNDALDDVLRRLQPNQQQDLIFLQNGMLLPWLSKHGLQHNTQVLLYMSAASDGTVTDGRRTVVCGPYSQHVVQHLQQGGVSCKAYGNWQDYHSAMAIKLLWSSIFWLLSAGLGGAPVGRIVQQHRLEAEELVSELLPIAREYLTVASSSKSTHGTEAASAGAEQVAVQHQQQRNTAAGQGSCNDTQTTMQQQQRMQQVGFTTGDEFVSSDGGCNSAAPHQVLYNLEAVVGELVAYSLAIASAVPSLEMARKEFAWRNGWFLSRRCTPAHARWLVQAGCQDLLQQYSVTR